MPQNSIEADTGFLLDMDGTLYHGDKALPYADQLMQALHDKPHRYITNNPVLTSDAVAQKLQRLGIANAEPHTVITSAQATADWLYEQNPAFKYFAIGGAGLHHELQRQGEEDAENADFVVVGEGEGLNYETLTIGINLILKKGAILVSTNPDNTVDAENYILPGGGALVAAFAAATNTTPITIGKPKAILYEMALKQLGLEAQHCIMVGDRPDTDIFGAQQLGLRTALVRTGCFAPNEELPQGVLKPNWDVNNLNELLKQWQLC